MKNINKLITVVVLLAFVGCSDINESFTNGYHENPNDPTGAPIENLFTGSQAAMIMLLEGHPARLANLWTQHATGGERQYAGYYSYNVTGDDLAFGNAWEIAYNDILSSLRIVQERGEDEGGLDNILAISKILEAATIGTVTALWGDVPYSQALNPDENLTPEVDDQTAIYDNVQRLLDEGIASLESDPRDLAAGVDIFSYGGDANSWIRAAYTLKARFYMHVGNYEAAISAAENGIQAIDGSEDLNFIHGTTHQGNMNIWYSFMENDRVGYITATDNHAYSLMEDRQSSQTDESGRMSFYYSADGEDLNIGTDTTDNAFAPDADYPFLTAGETHLILAEASLREGATQSEVISHLNEARAYNGDKYTDSTYDPFVASDFGSDEALRQEIYDETYLSLTSQIEAFNFCRRIDYQITGLEPVSGQNRFPERFIYPNTEQNANPNIPLQTSEALFTPTPVNE